MASWRPDIASKPGTRAEALAEAISSDIASGLLRPGERLPPQRELAYLLGLSPNTVMRAYAEAARRGHVGGEVGRGTFVRAPDAETLGGGATLARPRTGPIDFALNLPFPGAAESALRQSLAEILRAGQLSTYLDHQATDAGDRHRQAGAALLERLGFTGKAEQVVATSGAQQGIVASLLATLRPDEVLLTERLTYAPVKGLARHLGLRLLGLAMDEEGLDPAALDAACRSTAAKVLYCTPTLQTPTTATMSGERRKAVARVVRKHGLIVIEDDTFGLLPMERPSPLAALVPEQTILLASLSKAAAPGLRVGYAHAPDALLAKLRSAVALSSWMTPPLMLEVASRWIENGTVDALVATQRSHAERRQRLAREILAGQRMAAAAHSTHLWLSLPDRWSDEAFAIAAEATGVRLQPARNFLAAAGPAPAAVRICLSHEPEDERVTQGLRLLAELLGETPSFEAGP